MIFYDGHGNIINQSGGISGTVTPKDCSFFDSEYPTYSNLFDPGKITYGYLEPSSGVVNESKADSWWTTEFIGIEGGAYLYCEHYNSDGTTEVQCNRVSFYDADKKHISCTTMSAPLAIPANAKYTRCCWGVDHCNVQTYPYNLRFFFVGVADDNSATALPFEYYYADKTAYIKAEVKQDNIPLMKYSPLWGKHLVVFGDSLMDVHGGHDLNKVPYNGDDSENDKPLVKICHEFNMTLDNRAKAGSNISTHTTQGYTDVNGKVMLDAYITEVNAGTAKAPDYILIAFGTNEYAANAGTAEDASSNTDTYAGAMKYFIETVRANFPSCVFGFVLPPQSDWSIASVTYKDPSKARDVALEVLALDDYAVPYINMWTESGITADMASDGVHVNKEGAGKILYYHALRRFVMSL